MPPRSTGCFLCRKRKIRCDEGRPGCDRCAKHGVTCPGYRRERGGIEFEDQTSLTVERAKGQRSSKSSTVARKPLQRPPQDRNAFQSWSIEIIPQRVASPALDQKQIYERFIDIYSPGTAGTYSKDFDYLRTVSQLAPEETALRDGLNTLALVQVGHVHKDEQLLHASVGSYGRALGSLAKAVSRAKSVNDDTVLAAASLLIVCEFYDQIKSTGAGWFGHVRGVEHLLLARGPDSLTSPLSLWLFHNARIGSLARSFLIRKYDPYATPAWRLAAFRAPVDYHTTLLFDSVGQVPGLLERYDCLNLNALDALLEIEKLLSDCETLEVHLRSWKPDYHRGLASSGSVTYELTPIHEFGAFNNVVSDRSLTMGYRFKDYPSGYMHSQYWIGMHYLRSTIKYLRELRQEHDEQYTFDHSKAVTDEELNEYAFDLCRYIPFAIEPGSGTQGHIGCFLPLAVVLFHFRKRQNYKWLRWALEVKAGIFTKGLRQPNVREEDLPMAKLHAPPRDMSFFHSNQAEKDVLAKDDAERVRVERIDTEARLAQGQRGQVLAETDFSQASGSVYDDMADVSLAIDWSQTMPGMSAIAQGQVVAEVQDDMSGSGSVYGFYDSSYSEAEDTNLDFTPSDGTWDFSMVDPLSYVTPNE